MVSDTPPWLLPTQSAHPASFSNSRALQNLAFLKSTFGPKFLVGAKQAPRYVKNPILQKWINGGQGSYLELNALAEDLQVVQHAEGFNQVLCDLRDNSTCLSTWHTIHSAALLSRSEGVQLLRFFAQTDETVPDFLIEGPTGQFACEAKLLAASGIQQAFEAFANVLSERVLGELMIEPVDYPVLTVVIKEAETPPKIDEILPLLGVGLKQFNGPPLSFRSARINVFVEHPGTFVQGMAEVRAINILGKKSEKEDLRVHRRGQQASKQLQSPSSAELPGLLVLSIGDLQEPEFLEAMFRRRFSDGQYSGLSGALLIRSGTHSGPPVAAPLDLISIIKNPSSSRPLPHFMFQPVGLLGRLRDVTVAPHVPAYRHQLVQGKAKGGADAMLGMPDLRLLTPQMLAD